MSYFFMPPHSLKDHTVGNECTLPNIFEKQENQEKNDVVNVTAGRLSEAKNKCNAVFQKNFKVFSNRLGKTLKRQRGNIDKKYKTFKEKHAYEKSRHNDVQDLQITNLGKDIQEIYTDNKYIDVSLGKSDIQVRKFEALYKDKINEASFKRITEDLQINFKEEVSEDNTEYQYRNSHERRRRKEKQLFLLDSKKVYSFIEKSVQGEYGYEELSVEEKELIDAKINEEITEKFQKFLYEKIQWRIRNLSPREEYFIEQQVDAKLKTELSKRSEESLSPEDIATVRARLHEETVTLYVYNRVDSTAQKFMLNNAYEKVADEVEEEREAEEEAIEITEEEYTNYDYIPDSSIIADRLGTQIEEKSVKTQSQESKQILTEAEKAEKKDEIESAKKILGVSSEDVLILRKDRTKGIYIEKPVSSNSNNTETIRMYIPENAETDTEFLVEITDKNSTGIHDIALKVTKENMQEKVEKVTADLLINTLHLESFFPKSDSSAPTDDKKLQFVNICMNNGGTTNEMNEEKYEQDSLVFTPYQAFENVVSVLRNVVGIPYSKEFSLDDAAQEKQIFDKKFVQEKFLQLGMLDDTNMLNFKKLNLFKKLSAFQQEIGGDFSDQKRFIKKLKKLTNSKLVKKNPTEDSEENETYTLMLNGESVSFSMSEETGFSLVAEGLD